jgi:NADPH-dependent 2,4-dienoyl-CoA reductase/sulfur reductase-like enzyme
MTTHLLIGGGIAALSAAEAIRRADPAAALVMVTHEGHGFYSRPGLAYLLAGAIPEKQLMIRERADLRELGLEVRVDQVVGLDPIGHVAQLARGGALRYDRALIATGASALVADFPGGLLSGVVHLDGLDDARAIIARTRKAKTAVVVGGGPTALELAEGLRARGLKVHYLMRGPRYWASVLDPSESQAIEDALVAEGIEVHPRTKIARAVGDDQRRVVAIETDRGDELRCDLVAVAIGVAPNVGLARAAGLTVDRGVVVDEYLQTSAPDVFAAGDVAQIRDPATGGSHLDVLWSTALRSGRAAGRGMAGVRRPYRRQASLNVTRLGGVIVTVIGAVGPAPGGDADEDLLTIARGDSEAWRARPPAWTVEHRREACRIRVVVDATRVLGAVVLGDPAASRALCRLIDRQVDIAALRPGLERDPDAAMEALLALGEGTGEDDEDAPRA